MNRKTHRLLAFLLTITMLIGMMPLGAVVFAKDNAQTLKGLDTFIKQVCELEKDTALNDKNEAESQISGNFSTMSSTKRFEMKRLIVKSDAEIDDMGAVAKAEGFLGLHVFQYADEKSTQNAYSAFKKNRAVEWVQADSLRELSSLSPTIDKTWLTADGSTFMSWGADYIGAGDFLESLQGKDLPIVTVAVIDTGIDTDHELFKGFYDPITNPDGRILKNGTNLSYTGTFGDPEDENGHGTHCAGTIVEMTPSNVKILPVKILCNEGYCSTLMICLGVLYAAENGADIANMSLGGGIDEDSFLEDYTLSLAAAKNLTTVVAAGNESSDALFCSPANSDSCITVSAVLPNLEPAWFSNYGSAVDVAAPGMYILSAAMDGEYVFMSGTSMATPHVAAVAALYKTERPDLTADELKNVITENAVDVGAPGKDIIYGCGLAYAQPLGTECAGTVEINYNTDPFTKDDSYYAFYNPVTVTLEADGAEKIYYTTDGTDPSGGNAVLYSEPFTITNTSRLRTIAVSQTGRSIPNTNDVVIKGSDPVYTIVKEDDNIIASYGIVPEVTVTGSYVGDYAFKNQYFMKSVQFDDSVKTIGNGSFTSCSSITEIDLNNVTSIGKNSFSDSGLSGITADKLRTIGDHSFYRTYISSIEFPEVTSVGKYVFNQSDVNYVSLPKAKFIDNYAFFCAEILTEVSIPEATEIGDYAFFVTNLNTAEMTKVESIGSHAFDSTYLSELDLPCLKEIGEYAFYGIQTQDVSLPLVETVSAFAFADSSVVSVDLPNVKTVEEAAFAGTWIQDLCCPQLENVGIQAFFFSELRSIDLPKAITVGQYAFAKNFELTDVNLPNVSLLGDYAFMECEMLEKISLPSARSIGNMAFNDTALRFISLPESVSYIGVNAFDHYYYIDDETGEKVIVSPLILGYEGSYVQKYANDNDIRFAAVGTTFTVTFIDNTGKVISTQQVAAGEDAVAPKAPHRIGRVFFCWDTDFTCITEDLTVQAEYILTARYVVRLIVDFFQRVNEFLFGWIPTPYDDYEVIDIYI